jgi:glutamate 5-kinase
MAWARFFIRVNMKTIVIKIGSGTLLTKRGRLDEFRLTHIAEQIKILHKNRAGVVLVISGAVACGVERIKGAKDDKTARQVAAGIGQVEVISTLQRVFGSKGLVVAQLLLTSHTLASPDQKKEVGKVLEQYLQSGIVTIVNENDVVDLNGFGGNDLLAVEIATLIDANQVLILSQMARSVHGIGGGETKLEALRVLEDKGVHAKIVNGKDKNVILQNII